MASKWISGLAVLLAVNNSSCIVAKTKAWWETASFYQIYPRSFKDSNDDGVGDLKGVTSKLSYLKEIGITGTWLSPFLKSPMVDFGYDISNFTEVDPLFGSLADFEELMLKAKELDIKIILDFVPNHTSDECEWFIKSANKNPNYKDFYVWHSGRIINGTRTVPNNWVSVFGGSAWEWHEGRKEYYLHQFHKKQPDLNHRNGKVKEEMNNFVRFWLNKGVAGFRVDAIYHALEIAPDANGNYPDEPRNYWTNDPDNYGYLQHIYTVDQPETPHLVYEWRKILQQYEKEHGGDERILMVETWSPIDIVMVYYGNASAEGAQIPFNFQLISYLHYNSDAYNYASLINDWLNKMPSGRSPNWVLGSHDKNRVGSRFGKDRIDMLNILLLILPGCSITYNGEEIGMTDVSISWEKTVDPQACNGLKENYKSLSRDPARTPFQWSDKKNAGFSNADTTWLPLSPDYSTENVECQRPKPLSHLNIFKQLQLLRAESTFQNGETEVKALNRDVLAVKRSLKNDFTYIILLNIFDAKHVVNLNKAFSNLTRVFEYVVVTDKSIRNKDDKVSINCVVLLPKESVVLKSMEKL